MLTPSFVKAVEPPRAVTQVITTDDLTKQIMACSHNQFTGRLDLDIQDIQRGQHWSLYFRNGFLVWCTSEINPIRRWYRQLSIYCSALNLKSGISEPLSGSTSDQAYVQLHCLDYASIAELVRTGKILRDQMRAVIEGNIVEVLFDIHQGWERLRYRSELRLTYRQLPPDIIELVDSMLVRVPTVRAWQQALQDWEVWQQAGLVDYSPNLAPVIWNSEKLRERTSLIIYKNLTAVIDGNQSLRDLATKLKQNLLPLTQSLMPYVREGLLVLIEVGDLSCAIEPRIRTTDFKPIPATPSVAAVEPQLKNSLIACIDDSKVDSLTMNQILTKAGYQCISIQNPVQALPVLLEHKPDLIFLDLVMPVANGYEICAQIRRISTFKTTPIIILTSNDGIVDRVRAKVVGSSGFLAKPINPDKVLGALQKYLTPQQSVKAQNSQTFQLDSSKVNYESM